ncbi:hypothetical protein ABZX90_39030 [Streptomyces sp. NPDC002935]
MRTLLRLDRHLHDAPLFPIEQTAALLDYLISVLVDHPLYREVRDLLDAKPTGSPAGLHETNALSPGATP